MRGLSDTEILDVDFYKKIWAVTKTKLNSTVTANDVADKIKSAQNKIEEETKKRPQKLFEERVTENIPNLRKEIDIQVQQGQRVPNKLKPKRHTQRYITIKMAKVKDRERILQAAREKQLAIYEGNAIRFLADFSVKTSFNQKEVA